MITGAVMISSARRRIRRPAVAKVLCICVGIVAVSVAGVRADDWPEWRGKGRLGLWLETGILDRFPADGLHVKWRTPIRKGYAGPAVAGGRVFVTDSQPTTGRKVVERVLALDEETGKILWVQEWETSYAGLQNLYAIGPRATPTVDGDRVYALGVMGNLLALDTATGKILWQKDYVKDFNTEVPSWGITGAPLVDGNRLICLAGGEPDGKVIALNKMTGEEIWRALSSDWEPGYNQPTIIEAAGVRQLIIYHPRAINALDPATGRIYWEVPFNVGQGMTIPTPVHSGDYLFFTSEFGGAHMLRLDQTKPGATVLWHGAGEQDQDFPSPNSIHSVISTPVIQGDYLYGIEALNGTIRCLEVKTGKQVWESPAIFGVSAMHGTAFFVKNGDRFFINSDKGELIIAMLSPKGYEELGRTKLIEPTNPHNRRRGQPLVAWSHPAYANRHIVVRNDKEIIRASLAAEDK